ncbi:MAG: putative heme d1 biosynthesis radical SAM protein NirJ1 [Firmicutes bacterium]|nr:putative heme d1 biosynthesis radical SAM protein NirJ1 [Bacillota bacterium]
MIGVSKLLFDSEEFGNRLRYSEASHGQRNGAAAGMGPVVVWNSTRACNLHCVHCYMDARGGPEEGELTTEEALRFVDQLADFRVPVLLFSGGEPLMRPDFFTIANYARQKGLRVTLSTNGTLISRDVAQRLKDTGVGYVGISLDGLRDANDRMRGQKGAFAAALKGVENCVAVGQKVGLRFTINRYNYADLNDVFDLMEGENIDRACFYHLVYSGRGSKMIAQDITHEETRAAMDLIIRRTEDFHRRGLPKEILTVDNHADGVYLYLYARRHMPQRAPKVWELLQRNGGNRSGIAIAEVDHKGDVHPDQFTQHVHLGNVRERSFGEIWQDTRHPILAGLKNRRPLLKGRCARCRWLDVCNGNFRARAEAVSGDFWQEDPACYLTDEEIGIA